MNAYNFLDSPFAQALGWTLLHAIWQGFALVLPVAVLLHLLRSQSSAMRYRISTCTLLTQLLVSVVTFIWYYQPVSTDQKLPSDQLVRYASYVRWQTVAQSTPWHQQTQHFLENHLSQFVLIYLIGVALFGLRLAGGWLYLQRLSKTALQPANKSWLSLADRIRGALAIRTTVQIRESVRIAGPMVVGILKPVLLLPVGLATHLSTREVEAVIAHEMAHIKRHDYAVNLLQSVVEVLYFFHPALWWLSARVREEREHCCDDLAVAVCGGNGRILAQALARVEELRLTQLQQAPALAMAFAAKRQHLLHRVQRVLGMPTRPFVSNSSLAGLTLATILLMSISVYAVQKQPKPAAKQSKPAHSTRKHAVDSNSEYGMVDNKRIGYVIWKGQKLPATRVAYLQRQLNLVMAGKLSLDTLKQPDRDILLTIFEKNNAFDGGMKNLPEALAHIDYEKIVASTMNEVKEVDYRAIVANAMNEVSHINYDSIVHNAMQEVRTLDYDRIVKEAMASVDTNIITREIFYKEGDAVRSGNMHEVHRYHTRKMDSLSQLIAQRSQQMQALHLQMEKLRFPVEEVERANQVLEWRKQKLMEQRNSLIEKHQKLMHNNDKQKLSQTEVEKQLTTLEPEIKKLEGSMEALNDQMQQANLKRKDLEKPMKKLEQEAEQLENEIEKFSDQIGRHSDGMTRLMPMRRPVNVRTNVQGPRPPRPPHSIHTPRPMIAPAPPSSAHPMLPGTPTAPGRPGQRGRAHLSPPTPPPPAAMPKPAIAPAAERPELPEKPEPKEKREKPN